MTSGLSGTMFPMFLLLIASSGCFLADGLPSIELQQLSAIVKKLEAKIDSQEANLERQEGKIDRELLSASGDRAVRDLPYIMMCAYKDDATSTGIIAYDELTLDYSNCDRPGGACSSMDIASGTFTAETGGLYTITFSGTANIHENDSVKLQLLHNGSQLKESYTQSSCSKECGYTADAFSRTVIVSMALGDTLELEAPQNDGLKFLTMCVSLIAYPYGH